MRKEELLLVKKDQVRTSFKLYISKSLKLDGMYPTVLREVVNAILRVISITYDRSQQLGVVLEGQKNAVVSSIRARKRTTDWQLQVSQPPLQLLERWWSKEDWKIYFRGISAGWRMTSGESQEYPKIEGKSQVLPMGKKNPRHLCQIRRGQERWDCSARIQTTLGYLISNVVWEKSMCDE